jgi:hypothetical protein
MGLSPIQLQQAEAILNLIVAAFFPGAAPILNDVELAANIVLGVNPPTIPTQAGILTTSTGQKYGFYVVPLGAPGTSVTITF